MALPNGKAPDPPRVMPYNLEAEQALLGALLINNDVWRRVSPMCDADFFFEPIHQRIYDVIGKILDGGRIASPITIKMFLPTGDLGNGMTSAMYLAQLAGAASSIVNATGYAQVVRDLALRRGVIGLADKAKEAAYDAEPDAPIGEQLDQFEADVAKLRPLAKTATDYKPGSVGSGAFMDAVAEGYQKAAMSLGLSTGLQRLDDAIGGMAGGDLIILAGRPGMGKTALAMGIAWKSAELGYRVGVNSLEMSSQQLAGRVIAERSLVPAWRVRKRAIDELDYQALEDARRWFDSLPLSIDETPGINIAQVTARARSLKKRMGLDLLVLDYLQLMSGTSRRNERYENRTQELAEITGGLKRLAKELGIPIIALSQLSRDVEKRDDKRPTLQDLRDSGSIEQDADVVGFIYRAEYYLQQKEPDQGTEAHYQWQSELARVAGVAEIGIAKQRHGPTSRVILGFDAKLTRFLNEAPVHDAVAQSVSTTRAPAKLPAEAQVLSGIIDSALHHSGVPIPADVRVEALGNVLIPWLPVFERWESESRTPGEEGKGLGRAKFDNALRALKKSGRASWVKDSAGNHYLYIIK
jgi:replicative DNA helicase